MARKHKIQKALTHLVQAIIRFAQTLTSRNTYRFLRTAFVTSRRRLQAGFVLPTTTLLIIVMMLVVSTLMFRSYQRSTDVIGDYQRQELLNTTTPAINRAKSKLEKLFDPNELPPGIPAETVLEKSLLENQYIFSDETPVSLSTGAEEAPAWLFTTDTNGNGNTNDPDDLVTVYTILSRTERNGQTIREGNLSEKQRADALLVRSGPMLTETIDDDPACKIIDEDTGQELSQGWFPLSSSTLKKNFQVYALTLPNRLIGNPSPSNPMLSTIEYQQDRYYEQGNKWGAWFRTDMEVYPGPVFNWNGAMHSEGSIFLSAYKGTGTINSYLISSQGSCFYEPAINSEISAKNQIAFVVPAAPDLDKDFTAPVKIDLYEQGDADNPKPPTQQIIIPSAATPTAPAKNRQQFSSVVTTAPNAINLMMDPEKVLLDPSHHEPRSNDGWTESEDWDNPEENPRLAQRVNLTARNESSPDSDNQAPPADCPPSLDDVYRADDRFGPKTGYGRAVADPNTGKCTIQNASNAGFDYGEYITNTVSDPEDVGLLLRNEPPSADEPDEYGLDGYWERRARGEGTRIIVGQRLELGNAFGWVRDLKAPGDDPLNPFNSTVSARQNEWRQRKTLYDNLAAVQATAVYTHGDGSQGFYPTAYVATTVHPGTPATLKDSATFEEITFRNSDNDEVTRLDVDFFSGKGTNGWEFAPLYPDESEFGTQINGATPLRKALENLANFAGDPNGAFPAQPPASGGVTRYPSPELAMWGDYSKLRQIIGDLRAGRRIYDAGTSTVSAPDLSIADKSTLHTAAGTLGMLAYNIQTLEDYDYKFNQADLEDLAEELWELQDSEDDDVISPIPSNPAGYNLPPEQYISKLKEKLGADDKLVKLAHFIMLKEQVERDRTFGFKVSEPNYPTNSSFTPTIASSVFNGTPVPIACSMTSNSYFGTGDDAPDDEDGYKRLLGLSRLCSNEPKFPALYYLFPKFNHEQGGANEESSGGVNHTQPTAEPYISSAYIATSNGSVEYQVLDTDNPDDLSEIALQPRTTDFTDWLLPTDSGPAGDNPNNSTQELILVGNQLQRIPIKDSALYDGRENMSVRVLNLDMNMLRENQVNGDFWIPKESGIIYAFREDAVREDQIARPDSIDRYGDVGDGKKFNLKSVDYYADPDRRPYGFRLKNGSTLMREETKSRGVTFVTDNPIYTQGQFNLHSKGGKKNEIQEFKTPTLGNTFTRNDFYTRTKANRNGNFADPKEDWWRNTELIADSITILSDNFCDGSIEDGIIFAGIADPSTTDPAGYSGLRRLNPNNTDILYGCKAGKNFTSYLNQNLPKTALGNGTQWLRANPWENPPNAEPGKSFWENLDNLKIPESPIQINRNGIPQTINGTTTANYTGAYMEFKDSRQKLLITATETTTNMVLMSSIIPSRTQQINGGLHNFPRLLENWTGIPLTIQGSLIQLYFSNYATAPFDQDAWEYPVVSSGGSSITNPKGGAPIFPYYKEPQRNWGYDVALQKAPAGPAARRMSQVSDQRDEFYREPPADNSYICKLRALPEINYPCQ